MSGPAIDPSLYRARDRVAIRRALVAVSDKTGLVELARALADAGVEIVSTGGTSKAIADAGIPVTQIGELTGFPEHLDGRVRTLHPKVHSGLLADLRLESHEAELAHFGIEPFELVVVNLYPFAETVASGAAPDAVIEQIDIGGPAMVRASAKNHANVAVVVSPAAYGTVVEALASGGTTLEQRRELARDAFRHTADYDAAVAAWFEQQVPGPDWTVQVGEGASSADDPGAFVPTLEVHAELAATLRYGENSHQRAALYAHPRGAGIAQATQHGGKEMSYNNYVDADAALRAAYDHDTPAIAIIKHANPCGIATADDIATAHALAHACDPVSAYGGVIAANRVITKAAAESIAPIFTEVVVAPGFEPEALELLQAKKNLRLLELPAEYAPRVRGRAEIRQISGGLLAQDPDAHFADPSSWTLAAGDAADAATLADLEFAWRAVRAVKSNGILLASGGASVGVGMGQVNRVDSCKLAVERAGERAAGSVAASDAFFPFDDGPRILLEAGVKAIVQPGGSIRDADVIAACEEYGVTLYLTGERHFFH
ncbi:bifunctional phosphoribosylaminoimidazolecarboxamide formyltransferase/IMP cyclohydrolase [Protaetiibacter intestinalis]|uniref:Bifunctional purine biosynthesis protein PurH n=1 Tax=Protaetiibacter intestinalis TaxID=2419774 RepID=A0A387B950_9MICO|nr:bifunctional phosphoribosylaminoimidazolecarboxamide formyltransferase/IMP cyclohydrolase [Protaetiibacter intestinalis]AYF97479.1 bifunctional phosphoribosylaminoimidazolecarboxamide formyltransferase/IMP cyclohydrolase PurH [Protaetiibacter intestinalis]